MHYKALWLASWYPNRHAPSNGDFIQRMGIALDVPIVLVHACPAEEPDHCITDQIHQNIREIIAYYPDSEGTGLAKIRRVVRMIAA